MVTKNKDHKRHKHVSNEFRTKLSKREETPNRPTDREWPRKASITRKTREKNGTDDHKHIAKRTPHDQSHSLEQVDHLPLDAIVQSHRLFRQAD